MKKKEKIKLNLSKEKEFILDYKGENIIIENNIGLSRSGIIIDNTFKELQLGDDEVIDGGLLLQAYAYFDLYVLDVCTNIEMKDIDYEEFVNSGLLKEIMDNIYDYKSYKEIFGISIINYNNNINQSVLVKNIGNVFMSSIPNPENMEEFTQNLIGELKDMDEDGKLSNLSELLALDDIKKNGKSLVQNDLKDNETKKKLN